MSEPSAEVIRDEIEELADLASNYWEYGSESTARLEPRMRVEAQHRGLTEIRDRLVALLVSMGGEAPWWAEVQHDKST